MLYLVANVLNVFKSPDYTNRETGVVTAGSYRVQLMAQTTLKNNETRSALIDLTITKPELFRAFVGKMIQIPVGAMANRATGQVTYFLAPDAESQVRTFQAVTTAPTAATAAAPVKPAA